MTDAEMIEQRKVIRHLLQCAFAEQEARDALVAERGRRGFTNQREDERLQRRLTAEGVRLDAAIDAFGYHIATVARPGEGQPA